jgi:hypothetical protein
VRKGFGVDGIVRPLVLTRLYIYRTVNWFRVNGKTVNRRAPSCGEHSLVGLLTS